MCSFASGNHFNPYTAHLFTKEERPQVALSVFCVLAFLGGLLYAVPFWTFVDAYLVPYFIFTYWLSMVTYLQHTDVQATYYRDGEWSYLKGNAHTHTHPPLHFTSLHLTHHSQLSTCESGTDSGRCVWCAGALSTVDRSYFDIIDHLQHDIGTHVVHHLFFTKVPHYNLRKATAAIKPLIGKYFLEVMCCLCCMDVL